MEMRVSYCLTLIAPFIRDAFQPRKFAALNSELAFNNQAGVSCW